MAFDKQEIGFREVDHRYAELKRQHEAGSISGEEVDAQLKQMMVQDDESRWWAKSRSTGEWHYHDGNAWVRDTPPDYQRPQTLPGESTPDRQSQPERFSSSQTALPASAPVRDQDREKQRRGLPRWVMIAAGLLLAVVFVAVGIIVWMLVPGIPGGGGASEPALGYALFEHDSGVLSVETPSEWDERVVVDLEGEKGRAAWSSFLGDGESAGPSMTAVNDLNSWRTGTVGHQGIYMVASKRLAQNYTDDELITSGPNDYSSSCEAGTPRDFDRPPYAGRQLEWTNCGGDSGHNVLTLAAAPEGRECVVVLQAGGYLQTDEESIQHILDTFQTDCGGIA